MDLSAIIVTALLTALFFGGSLWMAIHSRRNKPNNELSDVTRDKIKELDLS